MKGSRLVHAVIEHGCAILEHDLHLRRHVIHNRIMKGRHPDLVLRVYQTLIVLAHIFDAFAVGPLGKVLISDDQNVKSCHLLVSCYQERI